MWSLQIASTPADLVLTDLYMPNQEGIETIAELRRCVMRLGIIAMSGKATAETMLSIAKQLGAVEVLQKPFGADQLLAAVERVLGTGKNRKMGPTVGPKP